MDSILDLNIEQLKNLMVSLREPPYRANQVAAWTYQKLATDFAEMSNLPQSLREKLAANVALLTGKVLEERVSSDRQTRKILLQLQDGKTIESTLMLYEGTDAGRERRTVCVSSQVGCPLGCCFCATGQQGFERNLTAGEILEQVLYFARWVKDNLPEASRRYVTNVVFMGMGEPLANYDNVMQAVTTLNAKWGLGLGARQITVSTAGLAPQIRRLADEDLHVELAVSLHAPDNDLRDRLMPINKKYPLTELIAACRYYFEKTGRRPTFEYALFEGINDSLDHAEKLARLLEVGRPQGAAPVKYSVNLIVGNPTPCGDYHPASPEKAVAFRDALTARGITSTIRLSRGADIEAGCGQLRSRWQKEAKSASEQPSKSP